MVPLVSRVLVPSLAVLLAACAPQLHVPGNVTGDVPVKLVNDTGQTMCEIHLTSNGENIVRGGGFFAHKAATIKLKPGAYDIYATSNGCGGTLAGTQHVVIQQATEIHMGATTTPPAAGFVSATIVMGELAAAPSGEEPAEEAPVSSDPYAGRTDCVHPGLLEGKGRCCGAQKSCSSAGCTCM